MQTNSGNKYLKQVRFKSLSNWSAAAILSDKVLYKEGLKLEAIGSLILRNREKEILEDEKSYQQVTIKLYGKGVIQRGKELVLGKSIRTKNQYRVSEGQFIMSKIDARNGAFGIVPKELEGAITTQDFLSYNINKEKILPEFFNLITGTQHFAELCQRASSGTTGRQRVDEKTFLNFKIPVPCLETQKTILSKHAMSMKSALSEEEAAIQKRKKMVSLTYEKLGLTTPNEAAPKKTFQLINFKSISFWGVDKILNSENFSSSVYSTVDLYSNPEFYTDAFRGKSPKYDYSGKNIILNQKCNRWNSIEVRYAKKVNDKWYNSINPKFLTKEGDIIVNSTGEGTIGRASLVKKQYEGYLIDSHMLLLRTNSKYLSPEFLVYILNSDFGQAQIDSLKSAKSTKQTELGIQNLMKIAIPIPDIKMQIKIAMEIKTLEISITKSMENSSHHRMKALKYFESAIFNID